MTTSVVFRCELPEELEPEELLLEPPDEPLLELPDEPLLFAELREELEPELLLDELLLDDPLLELRLEPPEERDELFVDFDLDSATVGHLELSGS